MWRTVTSFSGVFSYGGRRGQTCSNGQMLQIRKRCRTKDIENTCNNKMLQTKKQCRTKNTQTHKTNATTKCCKYRKKCKTKTTQTRKTHAIEKCCIMGRHNRKAPGRPTWTYDTVWTSLYIVPDESVVKLLQRLHEKAVFYNNIPITVQKD